jgi:hypothetical protein
MFSQGSGLLMSSCELVMGLQDGGVGVDCG